MASDWKPVWETQTESDWETQSESDDKGIT